MKKQLLIAAGVALLALPAQSSGLLAQDRKVYLDWAPKPDKMKEYTGVNKPLTRLDDVLARHKGQANWTEDVIETERYSAKWISMAPGEKTRTQFYGDDRTTWVVWGGQIRFTIKGQESFIAKKGFLVQVPLRVPYSMETVGNEPSLRFEVTRGGALPSYPVESREAFGAPPPPKNGQHYVKVSYPSTLVGGGMDTYNGVNKPYLDFVKDFIEKYPNGGPRGGLFMGDHDNQAAIIRGMGVPIPPATNKGHFHIANDEFWFILEGKIAYEMEGKGLLVSQAGDVVLALPGRFHRASWAPGQMDTRLAFNRSPSMQHNYAEDANGTQ
jgi:mannose-6-phosphate isomerase-like protein (cupin superfamily)